MNNRNEELEATIGVIVTTVNALRAQGAPVETQLSQIKPIFLDTAQVSNNDRNTVINEINKRCGVKFSVNLIKKAPNPKAAGQASEPVRVSELTGSVQINGHKPNEATFLGKDQDDQAAPAPTAPAPDAAAVSEHNPNPAINSSEENTMKKNDTAKAFDLNSEVASYIKAMALVGRSTQEERDEAWQGFIGTSPEVQTAFLQFVAGNPTTESQTLDHQVVGFTNVADDELQVAYMTWLAANNPNGAGVGTPGKSRFSFMGERDEGVRTSWVAVGSALVGGGMEAMARGGLTLGSAAGTLVGAGAAFFAGEQVDEHVDSQFGRYVVGGVIGLALGGAGSALGRHLLPGEALIGQSADQAPASAPAAVVLGAPAAQSSLLSLF